MDHALNIGHALFKLFAVTAVVLTMSSTHAAEAKVGLTIAVEGDGVFWNPIVSKIRVTDVETPSLAQAAGIVAGDEIVQIEGQQVIGRRAKDLQAFMKFNAGETRTLMVKHANGQQQEARLTKPKD